MTNDAPRVRDIMTASPVTIGPAMRVEEAADLLSEKGFTALPVVDADGKLLGMLRDDDLIASAARVHVPTFINFLGLGMAFPGEMKHLEKELNKISGATVDVVMQDKPPTTTADSSLEDVATILHDHGVNSLPVLDADRRVIGVVARHDIVRYIARTT